MVKERAKGIDGLTRAVQRLNDKNAALEIEVNTLKVALDETTSMSARPRAKVVSPTNAAANANANANAAPATSGAAAPPAKASA